MKSNGKRPEECRIHDAFEGYHTPHDENGNGTSGSIQILWHDGERYSDDEHWAESDGESLPAGWYWWACFPGCLPDGDPTGPFPTSLDALQDADEWHPDVEEVRDDIPDGFDEFWQGYLLGLAFTAMDGSEDGGRGAPDCWSNPGGRIEDVVDIDDVISVLRQCEQYREARNDCESFLQSAYDAKLLSEDDDLEHAGSDFHLTRNGHGAGFWDGDWPEHGDALTELVKSYGSFELIWREKEGQTESDHISRLDWMVTN